MINFPRLTDKGDLKKKFFKKPLAAIPVLLLKVCVSSFFYTVQVDTVYQKSSLQLIPLSVFTSCNPENKRTYFAQVRRYCLLLKKIISV